MALFEEEIIKGNSPYKEHKINEYEIGKSIGFVYFKEETATSAEYGDFQVWQGVTYDFDAKTEDALIASLELGSLIANTLLLNKQKNGAIVPGELYRIEKKWNKGDTYDGNKKAKGLGYELFHLKVSTAIITKVKEFHDTKLNPGLQEEVKV